MDSDTSSAAPAEEHEEHAETYIVGQDGIPGQGPHMLLVLKVTGQRITSARYSTYGCPAAAACGQFVTEHLDGRELQGKDLEAIEGIDEACILAEVGQMPLGREHCPPMTVRALRHALTQIRAIGTSGISLVDDMADNSFHGP